MQNNQMASNEPAGQRIRLPTPAEAPSHVAVAGRPEAQDEIQRLRTVNSHELLTRALAHGYQLRRTEPVDPPSGGPSAPPRMAQLQHPVHDQAYLSQLASGNMHPPQGPSPGYPHGMQSFGSQVANDTQPVAPMPTFQQRPPFQLAHRPPLLGMRPAAPVGILHLPLQFQQQLSAALASAPTPHATTMAVASAVTPPPVPMVNVQSASLNGPQSAPVVAGAVGTPLSPRRLPLSAGPSLRRESSGGPLDGGACPQPVNLARAQHRMEVALATFMAVNEACDRLRRQLAESEDGLTETEETALMEASGKVSRCSCICVIGHITLPYVFHA